MFGDSTRHLLTRIGELITHPVAFCVVVAYAMAWLIFSPNTFGWGAIATLATWMMTLFITRTEHRDTQAIHAKIDELLRTHGEARTELTQLDKQDVEEIVAHRDKARQ
jgi:low affinity Fe/Cu permease